MGAQCKPFERLNIKENFRKNWIEFRKISNEFRSIKDWWDAVKSYIRTIAIIATPNKKQESKETLLPMSKTK